MILFALLLLLFPVSLQKSKNLNKDLRYSKTHLKSHLKFSDIICILKLYNSDIKIRAIERD